jgi:hypothetical protein
MRHFEIHRRRAMRRALCHISTRTQARAPAQALHF